jgi:hypothetical protein
LLGGQWVVIAASATGSPATGAAAPLPATSAKARVAVTAARRIMIDGSLSEWTVVVVVFDALGMLVTLYAGDPY